MKSILNLTLKHVLLGVFLLFACFIKPDVAPGQKSYTYTPSEEIIDQLPNQSGSIAISISWSYNIFSMGPEAEVTPKFSFDGL